MATPRLSAVSQAGYDVGAGDGHTAGVEPTGLQLLPALARLSSRDFAEAARALRPGLLQEDSGGPVSAFPQQPLEWHG